MNAKTKSFSVNENKGFRLLLPNGMVVSTQFGGGNYCENSEHGFNLPTGEKSDTVEVAFLWDNRRKHNWCTAEVFKAAHIKNPGDNVAGWIRIDQWLRLLKAAQTLKKQ